jgi:hypothetical protein
VGVDRFDCVRGAHAECWNRSCSFRLACVSGTIRRAGGRERCQWRAAVRSTLGQRQACLLWAGRRWSVGDAPRWAGGAWDRCAGGGKPMYISR